jgi:hypothetical protein
MVSQCRSKGGSISRCGVHITLAIAVLVAGLVVQAGAASATDRPTSLTLDSDRGDFIGRGIDRHYTPADGSFRLQYGPGLVRIFFDGGPGRSWSIDFEAPSGRELVPGPYRAATRAPFQSPTRPGLDVSGEGRGCDGSTGRFQVLELARGPSGEVERFAADFEQHCESVAPALRGSIRYQASSSFPPVADGDGDGVPDSVDNCPSVGTPSRSQADADRDGIGDACDPGPTVSALRFDGEAGEQISRGIQRTWHPDEGVFDADREGGRVRVFYKGGSVSDWALEFEDPGAAELVPGTYEGATRDPLPGPGEPRLSVDGVGRACNTSIGRFEVLEAAYRPDGSVERFAADFEQRCDGFPELLRGQVRVDASAAFALPPDRGEQPTTGFCAHLPIDGDLTDNDPRDNNPFDDDDASIFEAVIECLAYSGITTGGPGGRNPEQYGPALNVTRAQMASFIARELDTAERLGTGDGLATLRPFDGSSDFVDVSASNVHLESINRLAQAGIALGGPGGRPANEFGPELPVTRAQMASFINGGHRLLTGRALVGAEDHFFDDDRSTHAANIDAIATAGIAVGDGRGSYGPERLVTRAQMAAFLVRHLAVVQEAGEIIPLKG